jgi:hypothetical protein
LVSSGSIPVANAPVEKLDRLQINAKQQAESSAPPAQRHRAAIATYAISMRPGRGLRAARANGAAALARRDAAGALMIRLFVFGFLLFGEFGEPQPTLGFCAIEFTDPRISRLFRARQTGFRLRAVPRRILVVHHATPGTDLNVSVRAAERGRIATGGYCFPARTERIVLALPR